MFERVLPPILEKGFLEDSIQDVNRIVRQAMWLLTAAIWCGYVLSNIFQILKIDIAFSLALQLQLLTVVVYATTFTRGKIRLLQAYLTPIFFFLIVQKYMVAVVADAGPELRPGTHALIMIAIIMAYELERIFLRVGLLIGLTITFTYFYYTHVVGYTTVTSFQQIFHTLVANGFGLYVCYSHTRSRRRQYLLEHKLAFERDKGQETLRRMLPERIALRLQAGEHRIGESYSDVTVGFMDIVGFTRLASDHDPKVVVDMLTEIFGTFDRLADEYRVEKIKTIGDGYMVAAGCPEQDPRHAENIAHFALACIESLHNYARHQGVNLGLRAGISTGAVIGGVMEGRRMGFDIFGNTVNMASRMESLARPGEVLLSPEAHERLVSEFRFDSPREVAVKGKGLMKVYPLLPTPRHITAA